MISAADLDDLKFGRIGIVGTHDGERYSALRRSWLLLVTLDRTQFFDDPVQCRCFAVASREMRADTFGTIYGQ